MRLAKSERILLLGNAAIALGAFHAGAKYGSGYPGTPSTEILEHFARFPGVIAEWAPNEKCAYEAAYGASLAGARALVTMKHVGLNVASDPFLTSVYSGVNGGLVLVVADDPGMHSSQNEQDSRHYARLSHAPMFEPADSEEAYLMIREAFTLSEKYDTPVILRSTTRVSHSSSLVKVEEITAEKENESTPYVKDTQKYVMVPSNARRRKEVLLNRLEALKNYSETTPFNFIEWGDTDLGIIASGVAYFYAKEAYPEASFLKLGFTYPLPEKMIRNFTREMDQVLVVEEIDPILEVEIRALGVNVWGKDFLPRIGELTPEIVAEAIARVLKVSRKKVFRIGWTPREFKEEIPSRQPVLCPGCGHRNLFFVLNKLRAKVMGDIGCYTLASNEPLNAIDTCTCMGAGIGEAHGFSRVIGSSNGEKIVAVIGDSTFVHSGITGLINAAYNQSNVLIVILDNRTTAMTGHQSHPGTGKTLAGEPTFELNFEEISRACGAGYVKTVDPYNLSETEKVLREAYNTPGVSVVIARRPCVLYERTERGYYIVDFEKCTNCGACLRLGCPALYRREAKVAIDPELCTACGACAYLCRFDAISKMEGD
jgi:indolepyruvate ferredoxin oxidoreductase alpha subunit